MHVSAADIQKILKLKYPVDKYLAVPECKIGSSWFKPNCSRFDLWVMARSWAHPRFIGCEIKVTRQDFLRDTKWPDYLPYCTEFYFVVPPGIIDPTEVPEQAGLMVATKNIKRLITKKKAPVREVEIPQSIFVYILMCRTRIVSDTGRPRADIWRDRLKKMQSNKALGYNAAWHIRNLAEKKVGDVMEENRRLRGEIHQLQTVKECMDKFGIKPKDLRFGTSGVERRLKEAMSGIPFDLPVFLERIERDAGQALKVLNQAEGKADKQAMATRLKEV